MSTLTASPISSNPVAYGRLMAATMLFMVLFGAVQVLPAVSLDVLGRELNLTFEQRGFLIAVRMAALMISLLITGHFAERPGKRYILSASLLAIAASQIMAARSHDYGSLLVAMIVAGLAYGVGEAIVNPLVAQLHPTRSAWGLNLANGVFSLGLVVGALTTGEALQGGLSWRVPFVLWALPPVVCAVLYLTPRYPRLIPPPPDACGQPDGLRRFLRLPLFWLLFGAMILGGGCEAGLTSWAPNYASQVLGASARGGAWTTILYGTFMAVGRFASSGLVLRLTPLRLMILSAVLCTAVTAGLVGVPVLWGAWLLFALSGIFVACFWPTILAVASDHISSGCTALFSVLSAAGIIGCIMVPWAIGALGDIVGLRLAMLVLPAATALLIIILLIASRLACLKPAAPAAE